MTKYPNSECEAHRNVKTSQPVCIICMGNEIEQLRVQLAGCGVAAMQNTKKSIEDRVKEGDYGYSASYSDVCKAVDREIRYRSALEAIIATGEKDSNFPQDGRMYDIAKAALAESV